jgi:hypothetical protein
MVCCPYFVLEAYWKRCWKLLTISLRGRARTAQEKNDRGALSSVVLKGGSTGSIRRQLWTGGVDRAAFQEPTLPWNLETPTPHSRYSRSTTPTTPKISKQAALGTRKTAPITGKNKARPALLTELAASGRDTMTTQKRKPSARSAGERAPARLSGMTVRFRTSWWCATTLSAPASLAPCRCLRPNVAAATLDDAPPLLEIVTG